MLANISFLCYYYLTETGKGELPFPIRHLRMIRCRTKYDEGYKTAAWDAAERGIRV